MIWGMLDHFWFNLGANRHRFGAAVLKTAAHWNLISIGGLSLQSGFMDRFGIFKGGYGLKQGNGIGVERIQVEIVGIAYFEDPAKVHDNDFAADVPDDAQVVRYE